MLASLRVVPYPRILLHFFFFFFNDTATTEIYTLSLHDALPISMESSRPGGSRSCHTPRAGSRFRAGSIRSIHSTGRPRRARSEEHTSELQSRLHLVCRLLLEKKKKKNIHTTHDTPHKQSVTR